MSKYKTIAVVYGSDSSEWEVSCRSGEFVASRIDGSEYDVYEIFARFGKWQLFAAKKCNSMRVTFPEGARPEVDKNDFSVQVLGERVKFDYASPLTSIRRAWYILAKYLCSKNLGRTGASALPKSSVVFNGLLSRAATISSATLLLPSTSP